jgi:hypothetical protein
MSLAEKRTMDVLLDVLNARANVPDRNLPVLNPKTQIDTLQTTAAKWLEENLIRDCEGELDWAGLIVADLFGALAEQNVLIRRKRLIETMAIMCAAIEEDKWL